MKKSLITFAELMLSVSCFAINGSGTSNDPYKIGTSDELFEYASIISEGAYGTYAVLTSDIKVSDIDPTTFDADAYQGKVWEPIGDSYNFFDGVFDGNNHTISGLVNNQSSTIYYQGLFGGNEGTIKNLTIKSSYFAGVNDVGVICGINEGCIDNCHTYDCVVVGKKSDYYLGSFCTLNNGTIKNCTSFSELYSNGGSVGGIAGYNYSKDASIVNCGFAGTINSSSVATIAGGITKRNNGSIQNCYSAGTFSGTFKALYGVCGSGLVKNCYYDSTKCHPTYIYVLETACPTEAFTSGKVCYMLNELSPAASTVWHQDIATDTVPLFTGKEVYRSAPCTGFYSNTEGMVHEHEMVDGVCSYCGKHEHNYEEKVCTICGKDERIAEDGTFQIYTADDLYVFAKKVNDDNFVTLNARLMDDIVVNDTVFGNADFAGDSTLRTWTPIGNKNNYYGSFDGNGHTISGLYYIGEAYTYLGLFGTNGYSSLLKNIVLVNSYFENTYNFGHTGGISCWNYGTIVDSENHATIKSKNDVGGICCYNWLAITDGCKNYGDVASTGNNDYAGGITSNNYQGLVIRCGNHGAVRGAHAGGICGLSGKDSGNGPVEYPQIHYCYNVGDITGTNYAGGLDGGDFYKISHSYNAGKIASGKYYGAIAAGNFANYLPDPDSAVVQKCYALVGCDSMLKGVAAEAIPASYGITVADSTTFASGAVTYALNEGVTDDSQPFFQTIQKRNMNLKAKVSATDTLDKYPLLDPRRGTVYFDGQSGIYYNYEIESAEQPMVETSEKPSIYTLNSAIVISNYTGSFVVYDATGRKITSGHTDGETEIVLQRGIYFAVVAGNTYKVHVGF